MSCDYVRGDKIGAGSFGQVYQVINSMDNVEDVIKFYTSKTSDGDEMTGGLGDSIAEIDVMFNVGHASLVKGIALKLAKTCPELFEGINSQSGVVMNKFNGGDMSNMGSVFNLNYPEGVNVFDLGVSITTKCLRQLASAITCLGEAGYYNFDIKPSNVLYNINSNDGVIYSEDDIDFFLSDYGLCIPIRQNGQDLEPGRYLSTPLTTAPESFGFNKVYMESSMSWSLSLTVLTIFLGSSLESMLGINEGQNVQQFFKYMIENIESIVEGINSQITSVYTEVYPQLSSENKPQLVQTLELLMGMLIINVFPGLDKSRLRPRQVTEQLKDTSYLCTYETYDGIGVDDISDEDVGKITLAVLNCGKQSYGVISLALCLTFRYFVINDQRFSIETIAKYCVLIARYFYGDNTVRMTRDDELDIVGILITLNGVIYINPIFNKSFTPGQVVDVISAAINSVLQFKDFMRDGCPYELLDLEFFQNEIFPSESLMPGKLVQSPLRNSNNNLMY